MREKQIQMIVFHLHYVSSFTSFRPR